MERRSHSGYEVHLVSSHCAINKSQVLRILMVPHTSDALRSVFRNSEAQINVYYSCAPETVVPGLNGNRNESVFNPSSPNSKGVQDSHFSVRFFTNESDYRVFTKRRRSRDVSGSSSAMARSVSTCLMRPMLRRTCPHQNLMSTPCRAHGKVLAVLASESSIPSGPQRVIRAYPQHFD